MHRFEDKKLASPSVREATAIAATATGSLASHSLPLKDNIKNDKSGSTDTCVKKETV